MSIGAPDYIQDTNTQDLTASSTFPQGSTALTLTANDASVQFLDPPGSTRIVVLPALADGLKVTIINNQSNAEIITINDAAGNTVGSPTGLEAKTLYCDGTTWQGPETTLHS